MYIFDLDGTLLDTILDMADSMNRVLRKYNLKENTVKDYISFIGNGAYILAKRSVRENVEYLDLVYNDYILDYKNNQTNLTRPFVDIDVLKELKAKHQLVVLSNKPDSDVKNIVQHYFPNIFDYVLGNIEGVKHKPSIEPLLYLKDKINIIGDITYIGDSLVDLEFSKNANINFIGVSYGYGNLKDCKIIDNIKELL